MMIFYTVGNFFAKNWLNFVRLWQGIKLIWTNPEYRNLVVVAIFSNVLAFIASIVVIWTILWLMTQRLENIVQIQFFAGIEIGFAFLFIVVAIFFSIVIFPGLSSLVNSVVYAKLIDRLISKYINSTDVKNQQNFILDVPSTIFSAISFEFKKLIVTAILLIPVLCLFWIPIIGSLLLPLALGINSVILHGSDLFEPSFNARQKRYRDLLKFIFTKPSTWLFLLVITNINSIPILNIFSLPITTSAATLLFDRSQSEYYQI